MFLALRGDSFGLHNLKSRTHDRKIKTHLRLPLILLFISCGGTQNKNNKYFGELPSLSSKFEKQLNQLKKEIKETTDLEEAFKLDKEFKKLKETAKIEIEIYTNSFLFPEIPFENLESDPFSVFELHVNGTNKNRVNLKGRVKIEEDLKNQYGGYQKSFFAYIKAVDQKGNLIGNPTVMASDMSNRGPFKAGAEVDVFGSIGPLCEFEDFDKIIFITKEEYQQNK